MINLICFVLIAHLLGDYHLQFKTIAENKNKKLYFLYIHAFTHFILFFIIACFYNFNTALIIFAFIVGISHFFIDLFKRLIKNEKLAFILDQSLHILIISFCVLLFRYDIIGYNYHPINYSAITIYLQYFLVYLIISKPANIIYKIFFSKYKPDCQEDVKKTAAGALIGTMERIAIAVAIIVQSYASIGLILTAKSIARYKKISEESEFAEYYLIGTLYSLIYTVFAYALVFNFLPWISSVQI